MSIVVNLPAELENAIAAEAAKAGMTVSDYVAGRLAQGTTTNGSHGSKRRLTGPELVQRWKELGLIGYRTDTPIPRLTHAVSARQPNAARPAESRAHGTHRHGRADRRPAWLRRSSGLVRAPKLHLSNGLGLLDSLIAATAVGHGGVLNTFNERHYRMFPGLTTVRPYRR